jgi:hypothetical protein
VRYDHDAAEPWKMFQHGAERRQAVERLSAVVVAVDRNENLGRDLSEAVHDAIDAEIR